MSERYRNSIDFFYAERSGIVRDSLTQVLDRQTMVEYMEWLIERNNSFSFFFIDVDNFKNVNDTYGHLTGDAVLSAVARYLEEMTEGKGVVGRYGGDEFMLILRDIVDYSDVWELGNALNSGLSALSVDSAKDISLTMSMGISRFPQDATNYDGIVSRADKVLYRAKLKGRNCFIIYNQEKHANINLRETMDAKLSAMELSYRVFYHLTAYGEDIAVGISNMFRHLVAYYLFDHICIQDRERINFDTVYEQPADTEFDYIPRSLLSAVINKSGHAVVGNTMAADTKAKQDLRHEMARQKIKSSFVVEISAYDKRYGYIRVDTVKSKRIWQDTEMSLLIIAANAIGLLLYYQRKKLEDLPFYPRYVAYGND